MAQCLGVWLLKYPSLAASGISPCGSPSTWHSGPSALTMMCKPQTEEGAVIRSRWLTKRKGLTSSSSSYSSDLQTPKLRSRAQRLFGSQDYSPVAPTPSAHPHRAGGESDAFLLSARGVGGKGQPTDTTTERSQLNPPTLPLGLIPATHSDNEGVSAFSLQIQPCTVLPGPGAPLRPRISAALPFRARLWPHPRQPGPAPLQPGPESGSVALWVVNPAN